MSKPELLIQDTQTQFLLRSRHQIDLVYPLSVIRVLLYDKETNENLINLFSTYLTIPKG